MKVFAVILLVLSLLTAIANIVTGVTSHELAETAYASSVAGSGLIVALLSCVLITLADILQELRKRNEKEVTVEKRIIADL
jgi:uncharacterized membrane protein (TIGR02234 family)